MNAWKNNTAFNFLIGLNLKEVLDDFWRGFTSKIAILITKAITPPSLLGILRKIAYANKKYHSGWMWTGVLRGLAGIKFSGSVDTKGKIIIIRKNKNNVTIAPIISFEVKKGWNWILSLFIEIFNGLDEPVEWSVIIWINAMAEIIKGNKKWSEKNRVKVGLLTENPPHNHFTIISPHTGIAEIMFVITVAAQKDICPHGRTYPKKAVAINIKIIITPEFQVCDNLNELIKIFFPMWM